jgi:hypothetical protein
MDIPEILQFVDRAVHAQTDKHLNDLQRRIITGILKGQKYAQVSKAYGYSADHVKKVSHELLHILSDVFGEPVKKNNLESVLERQINVNITFGHKNNPHKNNNIIGIGTINNCSDKSTYFPKNSEYVNTELEQENPNQTKIKTIDKLRGFGLSNQQIADALEISLDVVNQIDLDE